MNPGAHAAATLLLLCSCAGFAHAAGAQPEPPVAERFTSCIGTGVPSPAVVRSCLDDEQLNAKKSTAVYQCLLAGKRAADCVALATAAPVMTPAAATPEAVTPAAVTPEAVTPAAATPAAVTPAAATPVASAAPVPTAAPAPARAGDSAIIGFAGAALVAGALGGFVLAKRLERTRAVLPPAQQQQPPGLTISIPADGTIQPCAVPVAFVAAGTAGMEWTWRVTGDAAFVAAGASMQYTFPRTGVYQVVVSAGAASDAVTVYAFETAGGRTTLGALLEARPAVLKR